MNARSNADTLVTVFGGSGFVGRHVVRALARRGFRIRVAVRRPDLAFHLQPLGRVGQIHAVQANVRYPASVELAVRDASAVINLTGLLFGRGKQTFEAVHVAGTQAIADAAVEHDARIIHMSALGADPESPGEYGRTKAAGEAAVRGIAPEATIVRPSVVFGPEDQLFNRFAFLARMMPVLPLVGGGETKFQPLFVGDLAEAIARLVEDTTIDGKTYELGGPDTVTLREIFEFVLSTIERKRLLVPLPFALARLQAQVLQYLPNPPLTPSQVDMLHDDNIVSETAEKDGRTLKGLGIEPATFASIVPSYLWRFRRTGQFRSSAA
ncbi:complex I NDUFA9 subunit family protein [Variibacter gotjawalensis]|uniref:complex I NDUFA9 subunit family protein n=1 Tax=Variibacter gotjawalensis TaxID=1333996 RepID=UPI001E06F388|nr:complex I NDUFA9 subunit family protein [Variibacter gotjawalensis]NIK50116.1 NADH dehydrogenase [Variibacter gotjawalensis]